MHRYFNYMFFWKNFIDLSEKIVEYFDVRIPEFKINLFLTFTNSCQLNYLHNFALINKLTAAEQFYIGVTNINLCSVAAILITFTG